MTFFDHLSIGVADLDRAAAFYDAALDALGWVRLTHDPRHVAYGFHLAFAARDRDAVDRFHAAALAHGGTDDGPPGIRADYNPGYYAAFVRDPDGHRLEAVVHE